MLIALLSSCRFLATKCMLSNNEPCLTIPNLIDSNPIKPNHFPFLISKQKL